MRSSCRAGAAWLIGRAESSGNAGFEIVLAVSSGGAVRTEAILGRFLGGWRHAHPYDPLYLEAMEVTTPDAVLSVINYRGDQQYEQY
jgi:hypothetical protein